MLIEFFGKECPHCTRMQPLVEQLEKEEGLKLTTYEVWHDKSNQEKMREYDKGMCGGVPFFINTATGQFICGESTYEHLKAWAKGEPDPE